MDIENLRAFISVAENSSFSRAAEQLFITQPAVSKRIATLEQRLDTRLFDRIGHRIQLTDGGRILLTRGRLLIQEMEDMQREVTSLSGEVSGRLQIGTSHHIGLHRLPPILRQYPHQYPDVSLDIRFMDSEDACNAVLRGDLEIGIVTLPPEGQTELQHTLIWDDPLAFIVGNHHPLCNSKKISPAKLASYPAILPATGTYTRAVLEKAFAPFQPELNVSMSSNYLETIKMLVSVGLGWSVLPKTMVDRELHSLNVSGICLMRELGVVRHPDRSLSNAASAMLDLLQHCDNS
ncbi:MAG TPA: LysR family transcriptional regulator [Gammaproteobacteria bacterium]|nr:LysR family transcriptional regulator [Gammaproteobacteria bacterium]